MLSIAQKNVLVVKKNKGKKIMSSIEIKNFNNPDETNTKFNNAKIDAVNVGGQRVNR